MEKVSFKLGVNSNNECGETSLDIMQNIKNAGFDSVMVSFKNGKVEELIKEAISSGLEIPFVHLTNSDLLWTEGESNRGFVNNIISQLDICSKYKIPIAVLHATSGMANQLALPPNENGLRSMHEILIHAKKCRVKIALENLDKPNFKQFKYLLDNIDSPYLGLCYDAGHHQLYNPEFDILKKYGHRILAVHLHDNLMDWHYGYDWTRDLHRLPFDGKIDYEKVLKKLSKTPYRNVIMLELHKDSCGKPRLYENVSNIDFLIEARKRAEKIANMMEW